MEPQTQNIAASYSHIAVEYGEKFFHELDHKPLDRDLLDRLVRLTAGKGKLGDMGCGTGQIARYLHEQGARVMGMDLAEGMLAEAARLSPQIEFRQGDMLALPLANESLAGITAFYSLIHVPRSLMGQALSELKRVLVPGGRLLVSFHIGQETKHIDQFLDKPVNLEYYFFERSEMDAFISDAGFIIEDSIQRSPYIEVEYPSQRGYILARKPENTPA